MDISNEYIRGLVEGGGSFSFHTSRTGPNDKRCKMPAFVISMHIRNQILIEAIRDKLGLRAKIYHRSPRMSISYSKTGNIYLSERQTILVVRDFEQLKDIIIPFFYKKLKGHKGKQFIEWLEKIGTDPDISDRYKSLYRMYKWGMYDNFPKFTEKFKD